MIRLPSRTGVTPVRIPVAVKQIEPIWPVTPVVGVVWRLTCHSEFDTGVMVALVTAELTLRLGLPRTPSGFCTRKLTHTAGEAEFSVSGRQTTCCVRTLAEPRERLAQPPETFRLRV